MLWLALRPDALTAKRRIQWSTAALGGILVAVVSVHWFLLLAEHFG